MGFSKKRLQNSFIYLHEYIYVISEYIYTHMKYKYSQGTKGNQVQRIKGKYDDNELSHTEIIKKNGKF